MIGTIIVMKPPAVSSSQPWPCWPEQLARATVSGCVLAGAEEHQRDEQVVPDPEELEDRERRERRHRHRQDQPPERREVAGAVDLGRLDDLLGQRGHVVAQDVDRQRHAEADVGQPHRGERAGEAEVAVDLEQRDEGHLVRHDQQADDQITNRMSRPGNCMNVKA